MLVPLKWLKDFVDINIGVDELAAKLVSCGFEIEEVIYQADTVKGVRTALITACEKHPQADKLIVCDIDVNDGVKRRIVTNNTWLKPGDKVAVALDGAKLASGKTIREGDLRGVHSAGMFVGGAELNLTEHDYKGAGEDKVLLLDPETPVGVDVNEALGTDDVILDVAITANRTDANGILGIAREVAAVTGQPLKLPADYAELPEGNEIGKRLEIVNEAPDLCPRYLAAMLENVVITESPLYIKRRLKAAGLRPINNIVDVTNYVLLEVGQPMHAFDLRQIKGGKIVVRRAHKDEKIVALDDKTYTLDESNLAICNAEEPMAIAGVMGGKGYSIFDDTDTVVFESARFARDSIRRTSRSIGLRSDSSARFEKGIDYYSQEAGLRKAVGMVLANGWGTLVEGTIDSFPVKPDKKVVRFTASDVENILGIPVPADKIVSILNSLTLDTVTDGEYMETTIPDYREDIVGINDIAEEVIRIYGYDHFGNDAVMTGALASGGKTEEQEFTDKIKDYLVGCGAYEIVTYSFISPKAWDMLGLPDDSPLRDNVKLTNPLGEDYSVMRTTLAHSMIRTLATNCTRGNKEGRFFELAKTYIPTEPVEELPIEENKLAIGAFGEREDFYTFKSVVENLFGTLRIDVRFERTELPYMHPTRTAKVIASDGKELGYVGEVRAETAAAYGVEKRLYIAELDAEYAVKNASKYSGFRNISRYPAVERDLALVCDSATEAAKVIDCVKEACDKDILSDVTVFDVYTGGALGASGKKSVAIKLVFRSDSRTLADAEVNAQIDATLKALKEKLGIILR